MFKPYPDRLKDKILGLAVTDVLRYLLSLGCTDLQTLLSKAFNDKVIDWACFLPRQHLDMKRSLMTIKKNEIKASLENAFDHSHNSVEYVKKEFIECFAGPKRSEILVDYHVEKYTAELRLDKKKSIEIEYQIYNGNSLFVRPTKDRKDNWTPICSIQELVFINFKKIDMEIELSRRNGIPIYLTFGSERDLKSFVSLLDGYHRLSVDWTCSLCESLSSPHLARLKHNKTHGTSYSTNRG